jgi:hypothetical protein
MMIALETFRARAKSMFDWWFDIIKETTVVDLKLRAAQPSRVVLCGLCCAAQRCCVSSCHTSQFSGQSFNQIGVSGCCLQQIP